LRFQRLGVLVLMMLLPTGCRGLIREWQRDRFLEHSAKVSSYHGTFRESGILDSKEDLVSEIWYQHPGRYWIKVISPAKFAGSLFVSDGKQIYLYFPSTKYGVLFKNLPEVKLSEFNRLVDEQFKYGLNNFEYELGGKSKVAGFETVDLGFKAKTDQNILREGQTKIFDEFSFPLAGRLQFRQAPEYRYSFDQIEFNPQLGAKQFEISTNSAEAISEWNFDQSCLTEKEAQKAANFPLKVSSTLGDGFELKKIMRQKGVVPAFLVTYEKYPYFVHVISVKDYGLSLIPEGRGLPMPTVGGGRLIPNPHLSTYTVIKDGVQLIFISNVTPDHLMRLLPFVSGAR
jgi:outer membrane lipoprotein-sorting protein